MIATVVAKAEELAAAGHLEQARDGYLKICQLAPHRGQYWLRLAELQYELEQFNDALRALEYVLRLEPQNAAALLLASATSLETGGYQQAIRLADQALQLEAKHHFAALSNKSLACLRLGHYEEALAASILALALEPTQAMVYATQGSALFGLERYEEALAALEKSLALRPNHAITLINHAAVLRALQRLTEALASIDAALAVNPQSVTGLLNRAAILLDLRRNQDALASLEQLLAQQPNHLKAQTNRILALLHLGRFRDAWASIQALHAVGHHPIADLVLTASELLLTQAQSPQALGWIEQGLVFQPGHIDLLRGKIAVLLLQERYLAALAVAQQLLPLTEPSQIAARLAVVAAFNANGYFREALVLLDQLPATAARDWQFYAKRGEALAGLDRFAEAQMAFASADDLSSRAFRVSYHDGPFQIRPLDSEPPPVTPELARINFEFRRLEHGDWEDYDHRMVAIQGWTEAALARGEPSPLLPFRSLFLPLSESLRFAIARREADRLVSETAKSSTTSDSKHLTPTDFHVRPLRIGYVSADFREHPTSHLMRSLFRCHHRGDFEVFGYSLRGDDGSAYYRQIKEDCDHFVDLSILDNAAAVERIRADGIQILIDLMTYTNYARPEIFALRPAPIQVGWLGFPGSSGAAYIDYVLVDLVVLPAEQHEFYTEQPAYLPECYQVNDRYQEIAETGCRRSDHGLPESSFVFCCFNQTQKLEPVMFAVWMRILNQITDAVLWLYCPSEEARERLRATALQHGISAEHLIFADKLPKAQHLERHRLADLFLDTRLYNAHTTASDALWAGLPVLTCCGDSFPARVAASLLRAVGLPELITESLQAYEATAVRLASNPAELAGLRSKLADNRLQMPLFDTQRFARHLEQAYQLMWARQAQGLPPSALQLEPLPIQN
jgi:predicted O-linked N-acetylglucosamine transferase (SPINDLY family)